MPQILCGGHFLFVVVCAACIHRWCLVASSVPTKCHCAHCCAWGLPALEHTFIGAIRAGCWQTFYRLQEVAEVLSTPLRGQLADPGVQLDHQRDRTDPLILGAQGPTTAPRHCRCARRLSRQLTPVCRPPCAHQPRLRWMELTPGPITLTGCGSAVRLRIPRLQSPHPGQV